MSVAARIILAVTITAVAASIVSCASSQPTARPPTAAALPTLPPILLPSMLETKPADYPGIHNAVAYHDGFISGSVPDGDVGFDTLTAMGIKTIITVDGAEPDLAKAQARGIRYIHLPIGYSGFDETRKLELTRATRDALAQGPVYIHCHHGKHRSAGAAGAVAASLGWITPQQAVERMKVSGTAPNYQGLYACASNSSVMDAATIDSISGDFPSIAPPQGFIRSMVEIDEISDRLKAVEKAGWKTPANHPDIVAVQEAGRMADVLRILVSGDRAGSKPRDFAQLLQNNSDKSQILEDMLAAGEKDPAKLSAQFKLISASCKECHTKYRD